ncbi:hypothetical protein NM208_g14644 [Fusarium decemcellulare]|uniref:Uncharacterized protein n=1 Tax=Fusarium decemcellulare TaxID=57161 RepID=A0ACC1RHY5_9HYPO|nr:hypothetical protein NM208_g14644 [Fusarium decemcellulare]
MAEAGIRPPQTGEEAGDKKKKDKDKKSKMFYDDAEVSPEERMAALPRYLYTPGILIRLNLQTPAHQPQGAPVHP